MKPFASLVSAFAVSAVVTGAIALGAGLLASTSPSGIAHALGTPSPEPHPLAPSATQPITVGGVTFENRAAFIMSGKRCGTPVPTAEQIKAMDVLGTGTTGIDTINPKSDLVTKGATTAAARLVTTTPRRPNSVIVPVYVHLIGSTTTLDSITDENVAAQIDVMNNGFGGRIAKPAGQADSAQTTAQSAFHFKLMGIDRTVITAEFVGHYIKEIDGVEYDVVNYDEYVTKATLRKGGPETLNLYVGDLGGGLLGYATFPTDYRSGTTLVVDEDDNLYIGPSSLFDGVVCLGSSLPYGGYPYDLGKTAVHEIGHWLGLFHPFQGGCTLAGDSVSDTPAEAQPYFGPEPNPQPDTCGGRRYPGRDPYENFMDYSDDAPMFQFTTQQALRMDLLSNRLRNL